MRQNLPQNFSKKGELKNIIYKKKERDCSRPYLVCLFTNYM